MSILSLSSLSKWKNNYDDDDGDDDYDYNDNVYDNWHFDAVLMKRGPLSIVAFLTIYIYVYKNPWLTNLDVDVKRRWNTATTCMHVLQGASALISARPRPASMRTAFPFPVDYKASFL